MNYGDQQRYLRNTQIYGITVAAALIVLCAIVWRELPQAALPLALALAALGVSIAYSPDYLHLTVVEDKAARWAVMLRWRIAAAVFIIGVGYWLWIHRPSLFSLTLTTAWILVSNLIAGKLPRRLVAFWLLATDIGLLAFLLFSFHFDLTIAAALLALSLHLFIVVTERPMFGTALTVPVLALLAIASVCGPVMEDPSQQSLFVLAVAGLTVLLAVRSMRQNTHNVTKAMEELIHFTEYSSEKVRELWTTSNQRLARNWEAANLDESDAEKIAAWYRQNSELYMFAISAYNLEYKRIKSNLAMMKYGSGKCLDYGAGNGELILEMARQGHPAVYYDVEGTSAKFAHSRAEQRKLNVEFCHAKDRLRESAARQGFDTIFSFDVLEHIPDLARELDFLTSLLAPGGIMIFDVPAGSTKTHPMHLNHDLNVRAHMLAKGMAEEKLGWSFRKQEKYLFRKLA